MIQYIQLRVGVIENLVHLLIEVAVLVGQGLGQIFLIDTEGYEQLDDLMHAHERTSLVWTGSSRMPIHVLHTP